MILSSYIHIINNALNKEELDLIEQIANQRPFEKARTGNGNDPDEQQVITNPSIRQSEIKWIESFPESLEFKLGELMSQVLDCTGWGFTIEGHQPFQYTVYSAQPESTGDFYTWHTDAMEETYSDGTIRKLSFTLQLSDPDEYEGGHFQWIEPGIVFDRLGNKFDNIDLTKAVRTLPFSAKEKGSIIYFPSFVHHQVTPVTRGVRKSLVGWCYGRPYV
jgi:PKHD-type hydroxylase